MERSTSSSGHAWSFSKIAFYWGKDVAVKKHKQDMHLFTYLLSIDRL